MTAIAPRPLLSVVVPVYDAQEHLDRCLESVRADPTPMIEIVAVDDASTDRSASILGEHARHDARLRVLRLPVNGGLATARNTGLDAATGDYVWFVDADDWLPDGAVAAVCARLAARRPDVLVVDHEEVFPDGRVRSDTPPGALADPGAPVTLADRPDLLRLAQSACTKVVRREFLASAGLRFAGGWYEDCAFSHPLLMRAASVDLLDRVAYRYWQQPPGGSITKSRSARHFDVFDQYARLFRLVEAAAPAYDRFRPELFRVMLDHYLVILGSDWRLPDGLRRAFFYRMVGDYHRWRPAGGYPVPRGLAGLKHRLVGEARYAAYARLRGTYRLLGAVRPGRRPASGSPPPAVTAPAPRQRIGSAGRRARI